jgi:hypothetical protein
MPHLLSHHAELIAASSISEGVAQARGYRTVTVKAELKELGFSEPQRRTPALLIPIRSVTGEITTYQIRPDEPRTKNGKPLKYETPTGAHMVLDVPPASRPMLNNPSVPLFITEGARKADSAVSQGLCCIALLGVWNFRGTNEQGGLTALADWECIALKGRQVYICFDSDVMEKDAVQQAMRRLRSFLELRGANVRLVYLPVGVGGAKVGLDDYFAAGSTVDGLMRLSSTDLPNEVEIETKPARRSQATVLIELANEAELFHTSECETYASVEIHGHRETWALKSRGFRDWLMHRFYEVESKSPSSQGFQDALNVLSGRARFDGERREVHTRIAAHEGAIYVDIADENWRIVQITAEGWRVAVSADAPVRFRRPRGMMSLPEPTRGGTLNELRKFINVKDDADWSLLLAWLVASLRPNLPIPLLALYGAQGSAKSTTARILTSLIDPSKAALRSEPRDERDLMIAARNRWCLTFDNLSHISNALSDALCRLATGGGLSTRELYSDNEETLFEALRPVIINGISDLATRGDLISRAIVLYLPTFEKGARRREADLWSEFEEARPTICGALFEAVSVALRRLATIHLDDMPRMADFAAWSVAAEPALGIPEGAFLKAYADNRTTANTTALDDSPLPETIERLLNMQPEHSWKGTASELLEDLKRHASESAQRSKAWPQAANALTNQLRRLDPSLRGIGVVVQERRVGKNRTRTFTLILDNTEKLSSASSASSADQNTQQVMEDDQADDAAKILFLPSPAAPSVHNYCTSKELFNSEIDADDADGLLQNLSTDEQAEAEAVRDLYYRSG